MPEDNFNEHCKTCSQFGQMRAKVRICATKAEFNALFCVEG